MRRARWAPASGGELWRTFSSPIRRARRSRPRRWRPRLPAGYRCGSIRAPAAHGQCSGKVIDGEIRPRRKPWSSIWSPPALNSDWVYRRVKLARDQKKLICVRTPDVTRSGVPTALQRATTSRSSPMRGDPAALSRLGAQPRQERRPAARRSSAGERGRASPGTASRTAPTSEDFEPSLSTTARAMPSTARSRPSASPS